MKYISPSIFTMSGKKVFSKEIKQKNEITLACFCKMTGIFTIPDVLRAKVLCIIMILAGQNAFCPIFLDTEAFK